jgi:hypothetical protein
MMMDLPRNSGGLGKLHLAAVTCGKEARLIAGGQIAGGQISFQNQAPVDAFAFSRELYSPTDRPADPNNSRTGNSDTEDARSLPSYSTYKVRL